MDKLVVEGGNYLRGSLPVGGSKNTALPLMAASLLGGGSCTLTNIPNLKDVTTFAHVLRVAGAKVRFDPDTNELDVDASTVDYPEAPYDLVKKMRASFYMLGALLGRVGKARVSMPGGCSWGPRPVDLHIKGVKEFGASVELDQGYVIAEAPNGRLPGGSFKMEPSSVGATINLLLAAVRAKGGSRIENAAQEPDVVVFGEALKAMGAKIEGLGTETIEIEGVDVLDSVDFRNSADRIELGTYMILAAMAGEPGETVRLNGAGTKFLGNAFRDVFRETGADFTSEGEGADSYVEIAVPGELKPVSITTAPYPGFPTDLQAQWTVLLSQTRGEATVEETIYKDRFRHIPELRRMGLMALQGDGQVDVYGNAELKGATVMSTDLRASVSLVMAGIVAEGRTDVLRVYHLDRGYEELEHKLSDAGIDIRREEYDPQEAEPQRAAELPT
jgi:UDP-N-acetylglucosamine 1-carboxyvinyltransferase